MATVLITGSANGIGASIAKEFARNKYNVIINYNTSNDEALTLKSELEKKYNVDVLTIKCDISNELEVINMIDNAINHFKNIDVLINNAALSLDNEIMDKTKEEFLRVLEVNVVGTFLVTKEVIRKSKIKTIINISSTDSVDTYSTLNIDYSSSKAGVNILTKTFALKYPNIKIYAVMPNWVDSSSVLNMNKEYLKSEMQRIGQKKLISKEIVSKKVYELVNNNDNLNSGAIIRIDEV